ncbi:MAG: DUF192 domain-containing protein [Candidatus Daviesbacteria bacterium]|nr:DUF192 domain-containing protein [Candidatus Daviesbacteria bacterium]
MKKFIIQVLVLLIVTFGALAFYTQKLPGFTFLSQNQKTTSIKINDQEFKVEIADNADSRRKGLSGRESLATDSGVLFVYQTPDKYIFWMKGVRFPLDFIWINGSKVVDIIKNVPASDPNTSDDILPRYGPNQPVDKILEVNSGFVDKYNINIGDQVSIGTTTP